MACGDKQFRVEAANAFFGRRHKTCVDLETADAVSLDGTSFKVSDLDTDYQVWFDLDNLSTPPTPALGETLVEVDISTGDNVSTIALAVETALEAVGGGDKFYVEVETGGCVCIEVFALGEAKSASADVDTGLPVETNLVGSYSDLGCLAEDFEFSPEISETDITCHQEGETPIDKIVTGLTLEIELGLLDTSKDRIKELIGEGIGNLYTPAGGTELIGMGSSSLGKSAFDVGGELRLVPVNDASRSWVFPLAVAKLSSLTYSGVEKQVLTMTFSALVDRKVRPEINFAYCGVVDQNIR